MIIKGTSNAIKSKEPDLSGVVPKRLNNISNIDELTEDKTKAYMYIDSNGTDKKISLDDFYSSIIGAIPRYTGGIE